MSKLRSSLFMRLVDLVMVASFIAVFCLAIYFVKWLKESNEPFYVTYVASRTSSPSELCITYRDSIGIVTCYTREESWSKQVCLPSHASAFLLVQAIYHNPIYHEDITDDFWANGSTNDVVAKIICGTSTKWYRGENFVMVDYSPYSGNIFISPSSSVRQ